MRIQGAVHALCLLLGGIARYLNICLPYTLKIKPGKGFIIIHNSSGVEYPLYLYPFAKDQNEESSG